MIRFIWILVCYCCMYRDNLEVCIRYTGSVRPGDRHEHGAVANLHQPALSCWMPWIFCTCQIWSVIDTLHGTVRICHMHIHLNPHFNTTVGCLEVLCGKLAMVIVQATCLFHGRSLLKCHACSSCFHWYSRDVADYVCSSHPLLCILAPIMDLDMWKIQWTLLDPFLCSTTKRKERKRQRKPKGNIKPNCTIRSFLEQFCLGTTWDPPMRRDRQTNRQTDTHTHTQTCACTRTQCFKCIGLGWNEYSALAVKSVTCRSVTHDNSFADSVMWLFLSWNTQYFLVYEFVCVWPCTGCAEPYYADPACATRP